MGPVRQLLAHVPDGNPSSVHAEGRRVRAALDRARDQASAALGVSRSELVFCSSGTEAVNLALLGIGRRLPKTARVVTWAAEHQSVLGAVRQLEAEGHLVSILSVDRCARGDPDLIPLDAMLISTSLANNELGTLQPWPDIARRAHALGAMVHLDAGQGPRWIAADLDQVDLASFSGQKLGAGAGGLLWARSELKLAPLILGGPQEWGRRAGREDVRSAVAIAAALEVVARHRAVQSNRVRPLAERLRAGLTRPGAVPTGDGQRLPGYATAAFPGIKGESLLMALDVAGVAASSGSACASGSLDPSHVLLACGYDLDEALGSLRLTIGYGTTEAEIDEASVRLEKVLDGLLGVPAAFGAPSSRRTPPTS